MLLSVMVYHKMVLTPVCDACISEADCDSVYAFSTASNPCSAQACGIWSAVSCNVCLESILNVTCVLTQQHKMALQGSLLASHTCTMLNTQQSYNAQDSGSIIRHKGPIRGSRVQMCNVYKGIIHGYLTIMSAVWAALLPVLER